MVGERSAGTLVGQAAWSKPRAFLGEPGEDRGAVAPEVGRGWGYAAGGSHAGGRAEMTMEKNVLMTRGRRVECQVCRGRSRRLGAEGTSSQGAPCTRLRRLPVPTWEPRAASRAIKDSNGGSPPDSCGWQNKAPKDAAT